MENLATEKTERAGVARRRIAYFFKETFRPHTKEEYAEVFTRGIKGESGVVCKKLPWLYIRVLALNIILFAFIILTFRLARYTAGYTAAILFGGLLFNFPLIVFFFELYPKRDLSLLKLFAVILIGGAIATAVILLGYEFIYDTDSEPNPWISTLWVGFWEEFVKGAVAISAVAILKNKNPFVCFLIGFAVGTGYSFLEDLGYIYSLSRQYGIEWLVLTSVGRGLSCVCSHAPWTGIICWAFAKFKKPFLNFRFYGVTVASMVLHYFADVPFFDDNLNILRGVTVGWAIEAVVVAAIFIIVFFMLKNSLKELFKESGTEFPPVEPLTKSARFSSAANLTAVLCAVAFSAFSLTGCSLKVGERAIYNNFYDDESFISCVQDGLPLSANWERAYDADGEDYSQFFEKGEKVSAAQEEKNGEYDYYYVYVFDGEEIELESIGVRIDGRVYYCRRFVIYETNYFSDGGAPTRYNPVSDEITEEIVDDGAEENPEPDGGGTGEVTPEEPEEPVAPQPLKVVSYFNISGKACSYSVDGGYFYVYSDETEFAGLPAVIALGVLSGVTLIGGSAAFISLKFKSGRNKYD